MRTIAISWYNLDTDGRNLPKLTTYHSFSGGWFLKHGPLAEPVLHHARRRRRTACMAVKPR